jgi:ketosteroid isomerase-like protein
MSSTTTESETTEAVLEHHLTAFNEQNVSELLADYTDESVLISNMGTFHGLDEIESLAKSMFAEVSQPDVSFTIDEQVVEGDIAYIVWHAETPDNVYELATDTYVIRDGVIETQTFTAKVTPKN